MDPSLIENLRRAQTIAGELLAVSVIVMLCVETFVRVLCMTIKAVRRAWRKVKTT